MVVGSPTPLSPTSVLPCWSASQRRGASPSRDSDRSRSRVSEGYLSRTFGGVGPALPMPRTGTGGMERSRSQGSTRYGRPSTGLKGTTIVANYLPTEIMQRKNRFDLHSRLVQEVPAQHTN